MAFDFKKEYKEFYMPKNKPEIVDIPKANYMLFAVRGIQMNKAVHTSRQLACSMRWHIL